jgi:4-amino-4-deoxy-L-arabinose transferase-like glycosyltransferase
VLVVCIVRVRLADAPLERDEGEYAYAAQSILTGVDPSECVYSMKLPGAYYVYALAMAVLGETPRAIRLALLVTSLATAGGVYALGRRWMDRPAGLVAAAVFLLFTADRWTMGSFAHATQFAALPAVAGMLAAQSPARWGPALAGLLLGAAVLIKQHAGCFVPLGLLLAAAAPAGSIVPSRARQRALVFSAGVALALVSAALLLVTQGSFGRMWLWLVQYAVEYISVNSPADALEILAIRWPTISQAAWPFWLLAGGGLIAIWLHPWPRASRQALTGLGLASALSVVPGFYFRPHYFILAAPAVALLGAAAISSVVRIVARRQPTAAVAWALVLAAGVTASYVVREREYLFRMTPRDLIRAVYGGNPFLEAVPIAAYIAAHTTPADRIAVLGSEPEIYFYAARRAATGYVYMYPLVEPQRFASRMQDEAIRDIESARPLYVVHVGIGSSWGVWPGADRRLLAWIPTFLARCYDQIGVVDIVTVNESVVVWDDAARAYQPRSRNLIQTYRRRNAPGC